MIWGNEEILKFICTKLLILSRTCDLIELNFDFIVGLNFINKKTIVPRFHKIRSFHFLIRKPRIERKDTVMQLSTKVIGVNLISFDIDVKRAWVFYFDEILKFGISIERWSELILIIKEAFIIKSVAYFSFRLVALFKSQ